jgi:ELWxxDGT repeat protein
LFFTADDGVHGRELWKSDGTAAGTVLVKDILPGGYSSNPSDLTAVGNRLFFSAGDGVHGRELWRSDGTRAGTVLVKDINPGPSASLDTGISLTTGVIPSYLTDVGGTLFFSADDGIHGNELWKSDGTRAGTVLVKDIIPGPYSGIDPYNGYPNLTDVRDTLFFTTDAGTGRQLWKSDGTSAGTVLVKDINPGSYHGYYYSSNLANAG